MYTKLIISFIAVAAMIAVTELSTLSSFLNEKIAEMKNKEAAEAIQRAINIVEQVVLYTMQTYVDSLKASGSFDKEAQKEAFTRTYDAVHNMIDQKTRTIISTVYGSFSGWLETRIEQTVRETKKEGRDGEG